ncbi:hypothetical protein Taro_030410 [Colocasia esculenta]|uniref:Pentatricopeptide repeat-containing protein n=1 Tax=Colocasia esculenta TaxID=4460 RepID=A0A843W396_COLES|nr:hypothetical protein [Colocasia esculenta]
MATSSSLSSFFACSRRLGRRFRLSSSILSSDPIARAVIRSREATPIFNARELDQLVSSFKEASAHRRFRSNHRVYEFAVRRLAAAGRLDDVVDILEAQKVYPDEIAQEGFAARIIVLYGVAGMPAAAEETFRQLPALGCRRTAMSFNALLTAHVHSGEFERVHELFRSIPVENLEIVPDEVSYNILIGALCKRKDLDGAMSMLEVMEDRGLQPNLITFNTLLNGFYSNDHFSGAGKVWDKMNEKNCDPDVRSFNAKLRGLVLEGRTLEAVDLVGKLPSMGLKPDTFSFNALIRGHCQDGNLKEAREVFENLTKNDCRPNRETFALLVPFLCRLGQLDLALNMCNESVSRKCPVSAEVLQEVVDGLHKDLRVEDAKKLVELTRLHCDNGESVKLPSQSAEASDLVEDVLEIDLVLQFKVNCSLRSGNIFFCFRYRLIPFGVQSHSNEASLRFLQKSQEANVIFLFLLVSAWLKHPESVDKIGYLEMESISLRSHCMRQENVVGNQCFTLSPKALKQVLTLSVCSTSLRIYLQVPVADPSGRG